MITIGLDLGSLATKVVAFKDNEVFAYDILLTGGDNRKTGEEIFKKVLSKANISEKDVDYVMSTGYGRDNLTFSNDSVTEIGCHAIGVHFLLPEVKTILDIGGQDSKAIKIDGEGQVLDFAMNDKCAAGTGRFLEVIAAALGVDLESMGELSINADSTVKISSMCTVFAESEVVSLVAKGAPVPHIVRGVHRSIAERSAILLNRAGITEPLAMSGGVAKNKGVIAELESRLKVKIAIPDIPQFAGALGAAIIAAEEIQRR
ncbi:MAG: 2-hydroxyglutaryl-CoA dehydratase [bacterium]|nr:2-hydroxyglutaryl-CoA dehydratase [bacterium]